MVVLPYKLATKKVDSVDAVVDVYGERTISVAESTTKSEKVPTNSSGHKSKRRGKNGKKEQPSASFSPPTQQQPQPSQDEPTVEISLFLSNTLNLLCFLLIFSILFYSPNNLFAPRTLFRAPVFTREECQHIIEMANLAAEKNGVEALREKGLLLLEHPGLGQELDEKAFKSNGRGDDDLEFGNGTKTTAAVHDPALNKLNKLNSLLQYPVGWKKDRHTYYPTTDLNLVTDPFSGEDREWLAQRLDARMAPIIERAFGISRGAVRANDIFVVRYDAEAGQPNLRVHTDSSHLSFNILLNDEFEGGGTRFHHRIDKSHIDIHPEVGETLLSHAMIFHEGLPTTKGTRYILVGFDSIDEKDPLTGESTNLSIFSSWLNFSWMQIRFHEGFEDGNKNRRKRNRAMAESAEVDGIGHWKDNRYATSLFRYDDECGMRCFM